MTDNKLLLEHLEKVYSYAQDNNQPFIEVSLPVMALIINQIQQLENVYNQ